MASPLSLDEIAGELAACEVTLPSASLQQLSIYLELLMRWNRRINLTGLREPRLIVRRLFAESLYLAEFIELQGWLVDVGSGAGFPGLALKLAAPDLRVTLLEPRRRKAAFLKEVIRSCAFTITDVATERFEVWVKQSRGQGPSVITTRAVAMPGPLLAAMGSSVAPTGVCALFTTAKLAERVRTAPQGFSWKSTTRIPGSKDSAIVLLARR